MGYKSCDSCRSELLAPRLSQTLPGRVSLAHSYFAEHSRKNVSKDQFAAAINAEYRSGQLAGAFIDRKEVTVNGLEGMSREQLEKKLEELSNKIDGYNAKTIEAKPEDVKTTQNS